MRLRPEHGFAIGAAIVGLVFFSFLFGRFTAPNPQRPLINSKLTATQVEKSFDLSMGSFSDSQCAQKGVNVKYPVCAWDYSPSNSTWAVTLFVRQPRNSIAHNPPISDSRG